MRGSRAGKRRNARRQIRRPYHAPSGAEHSSTYTHKHTVGQTHCKQLGDLCSFHSAAPVADQDQRGSDGHAYVLSSCFLLSLGSRLGCVYTSECVHNGRLLPRFDLLPTTVVSGRSSIVTYMSAKPEHFPYSKVDLL